MLLLCAVVLLAAASREYVEPPHGLAATRCWNRRGSLYEVLPIIITMGAETRSNTKEMGEIRGLKGRFEVTHIGTLLL